MITLRLLRASRTSRSIYPTFLLVAAVLSSVAATAVAQPIGMQDARFLLARTGFTPQTSEVDQYAQLTRQQAVDQLLVQTTRAASTPAPAWTGEALVPYRTIKDKSDEEKKAFRENEQKKAFELRGWWLREMLVTPSPLTERMTLFWHNHFVSAQQKVKYSQLMYRQNILLRQHALGNFGAMLHAVSKDPAMVIYLDGANNRKGTPNENFAREVMELFTLGEGNYSEQDIKEAARAFTGWSIDGDTGEFKWRPRIHDEGSKTVLGRSGNFDGDAVLDILLAQPACAEFVVSKLWREFVSPNPNPAEVARIARHFRDSRYDIKTALHDLFLSPFFWDLGNRGTLVKSPVELMVGTLRQFQFSYDDPLPFTFAVAQLGQNLFNPPNVKGWPGGEAWINSSTLLARKSTLERLFRATEHGARMTTQPNMANAPSTKMAQPNEAQSIAFKSALGKIKGQGALGREGRIQFANAAAMISYDPNSWFAQFGVGVDALPTPAQRIAMQQALLPLEPTAPIKSDLTGTALLRTMVLDPVFQLK
ncbi:DUF1800 family protein [Undibacterium arcticum]|uniref:DUF1800 family protein n=1 Tax=Undibacterium arcticum TaxID=1762892 RepID=A0ABV7F512_9BURK